METRWTITEGDTFEVITLAEAKTHLRVDHTAEDEYIQLLVRAAVKSAEEYTHTKITQYAAVESFRRFWNPLKLRWSPVQSVEEIKYFDVLENHLTWPSDQYAVTLEPAPAEIEELQKFPPYLMRVGGIQVTYTVGYKDASKVPDSIKAAILLTLGHLYENREDTVKKLPTAAEHLLNPFRIMLWRV